VADFPEEWSDERRRAFRAALGARRERQVRAGRLFGIVLIVLVAGAVLLRVPESAWMPAVGALAILALGYRLVNWKCPSCGERLPTRRGSICPGCGAPLDD
jgi:TRAP-type mannitol/chloroaromatic compound transport system permease large subunit